jgi:predicted dehydrogenase
MIRIAFLGCGRIARVHAKQLRRHRRSAEIAFASRDAVRAGRFARELGGTAYDSYDAAIRSPDVDVIAVVTPPSSHLELALAALDAGKHVILEKPPLPRAADFERVAEAAARAGKQVFVAENYRYKPLLDRIHALLAARVIGDVLFVHVNAIKLQRASPGDWRQDPALAVEGALYEGGIHWIDFMANLGTVSRVRGMRPALPAGRAIERSMMVSFEYAEGAVGMLSYSWEVPATARGLRLSKIYGREGTITFETNGLWVLCHGRKTRFYIPGLRDLQGYRAMWTDFVAALQSNTSPRMTLDHARRDLALVERAYASALEAA